MARGARPAAGLAPLRLRLLVVSVAVMAPPASATRLGLAAVPRAAAVVLGGGEAAPADSGGAAVGRHRPRRRNDERGAGQRRRRAQSRSGGGAAGGRRWWRRRPRPKWSTGPLARFRGAAPVDVVRHVLALAPRPHLVVSSVGDAVAALWFDGGPRRARAQEARVQQELRSANASISNIKFLPRRDEVVVARDDGSCMLWDAVSGRVARHLEGGHDRGFEIFDTAVFSDGIRVATIAADSRAIVWDAGVGAVLQRLSLGEVGEHRLVRAPATGDTIVTGASGVLEDPAAVWHLGTERVLHLLRQPRDTVFMFALSPCGKKLATGGWIEIFLWDLDTGRLERTLSAVDDEVGDIAISRGGATVVAFSDHRVLGFDGATGVLEYETRMPREVLAVDLNEKLNYLVALTKSEVIVMDASSGRRLRALQGGCPSSPQCMSWSKDSGVLVVCGSGVRDIDASGRHMMWTRAWDTRTGRLLGEWWSAPLSAASTLAALFGSCSVDIGRTGSMLELLEQ